MSSCFRCAVLLVLLLSLALSVPRAEAASSVEPASFRPSLASAVSDPEWGEALRDARRHIAARDHDAAREALLRALELAAPVGDLALAATLHELGRVEILRGQGSLALEALELALTLRLAQLSEVHADVRETRLLIGRAHLIGGDLEAAEQVQTESLELLESHWARDDPRLVEPLIDLAAIHIYRGAHTRAAPLLRRALDLRDRSAAGDLRRLVDLLHDLAVAYQGAGALADAEATAREALGLNQRRFASAHPALAISHRILGSVLRERGALAEADSELALALAILESTLGADHALAADVHWQQALVADARGDLRASGALAARALAIDPGVHQRGARFLRGTGSQCSQP